MENRDRMRDQGSPDQPPGRSTPGHEGDDRSDPRRTRENEERDNERQQPNRNPSQPQQPPKTA